MAICKKGTCHSSVIVSSSIYSCGSCGHTEIVQGAIEEGRECPKCHSKMKIISSHTEVAEDAMSSDNV